MEFDVVFGKKDGDLLIVDETSSKIKCGDYLDLKAEQKILITKYKKENNQKIIDFFFCLNYDMEDIDDLVTYLELGY
jgi:hypothetical protein